jgi:hypothetical protein
METNDDVSKSTGKQAVETNDTSEIAPPEWPRGGRLLFPQAEAGQCPTCGSATISSYTTAGFVYALGTIEARAANVGVEREFHQAAARFKRSELEGLTGRAVFHKVLSDPRNRYLVRQMCWVLTIHGMETYLLVPRHATDFDLLVEALRDQPQPGDLNVVIGVRGSIAPPEACNGLMVPIVWFDQLYWFDRKSLIESIPPPKGKTAEKNFRAAAEELFDRVMLLTAGGETKRDRTLTYLVVRSKGIYASVSEAFGQNESLTAVDVRESTLSTGREIVDVIFSYTDRQSNVTRKVFTRVETTDEWPFVVTEVSPYYEG